MFKAGVRVYASLRPNAAALAQLHDMGPQVMVPVSMQQPFPKASRGTITAWHQRWPNRQR